MSSTSVVAAPVAQASLNSQVSCRPIVERFGILDVYSVQHRPGCTCVRGR